MNLQIPPEKPSYRTELTTILLISGKFQAAVKKVSCILSNNGAEAGAGELPAG